MVGHGRLGSVGRAARRFALGGFVLSVAWRVRVDDPSLRIYSALLGGRVAISCHLRQHRGGLRDLLPIMPLDGGNILRNLLPARRAAGPRRGGPSFGLALGLCIWLWKNATIA